MTPVKFQEKISIMREMAEGFVKPPEMQFHNLDVWLVIQRDNQDNLHKFPTTFDA